MNTVATTQQTASAKELATAYFEHVANRDVDGMSRSWTDDSVDDFIVAGPVKGPAALREFFTELFAAIPDAHFDVQRITAEGDTAAVQYRLTGTFSGGSFQGIKATGKPVDFRGVDIITFTPDGMLDYNTVYYDGLTFARQIGMLPPDGSAADQAMTAAFNGLTTVRERLRGS
jgi:steroid delta-isomerase-like uncharacterized protein